MTTEEKLEEKKALRKALNNAMLNNISAGTLLEYTANNTKIKYVNPVNAYEVIQKLENEISILELREARNKCF